MTMVKHILKCIVGAGISFIVCMVPALFFSAVSLLYFNSWGTIPAIYLVFLVTMFFYGFLFRKQIAGFILVRKLSLIFILLIIEFTFSGIASIPAELGMIEKLSILSLIMGFTLPAGFITDKYLFGKKKHVVIVELN